MPCNLPYCRCTVLEEEGGEEGYEEAPSTSQEEGVASVEEAIVCVF